MNPLQKIFLYLGAVLACGLLLSPPIYWLFQWLATHGWFAALAEFPFYRYFSRITQVSAIILLPVLIWSLAVRSLAELGLERNPLRWRDLGAGVLTAFVPFAVLMGGLLYFEVYRFRGDADWVKIFRIFATAGIVACVEEFLFRGVLQGLVQRQQGRNIALWATALVFAAVHFLRPARASAGEVTWTSGFSQLFSFIDGLPPMPQLISGFLALLIIGLILGKATQLTQSLWLAIGLHAGWIFCMQTMNTLAKFRLKPPEAFWPWTGPSVVSGMVPTGLLPLLTLLLTAVLVGCYLYGRHPRR